MKITDAKGRLTGRQMWKFPP